MSGTVDSVACMVLWAFVLTIGGGVLEAVALLLGLRSLRAAKRVQKKIDAWEATERWYEDIVRKSEAGGDLGEYADGEALNEEFGRRRREALGEDRPQSPDPRIMPEYITAGVLRDQVAALRGPVLLAGLGVVASTIGSCLSIN